MIRFTAVSTTIIFASLVACGKTQQVANAPTSTTTTTEETFMDDGSTTTRTLDETTETTDYLDSDSDFSDTGAATSDPATEATTESRPIYMESDNAPAATAAPTSTADADRSTREFERRQEENKSGMFMEPLISYSRSDSDIDDIGADTAGEVEGGGLGLRIGAHAFEAAYLGVDARYERLEMSDSSYGDADGNSYTVGPAIGFQMPNMGIRLLGTYVLGGEFDPEAGTNGFNAIFKDPTGWRVGLGFRVASMSLNLEYQDLAYGTTDVESAGGVVNAENVDYNNRATTLSLSFPMEL